MESSLTSGEARVSSTVLYVARYKWPFGLTALGFVVLLMWLLPEMLEILRPKSWFGVGVAFTYVLAVMGLLETFVRRTWLMQTGIYQRSLFGAASERDRAHLHATRPL